MCIRDRYGTDYRRAQVFGIDVAEDWKTVYTPEGTFKAKALVLASGAMGRPASFKGEADFLGKGVSYCATCDGAFIKIEKLQLLVLIKKQLRKLLFLLNLLQRYIGLHPVIQNQIMRKLWN